MLYQYCDIRNAEYFNDLFGPLYRYRQAPYTSLATDAFLSALAPFATRYLAQQAPFFFKFDLSSICVSGLFGQMKTSYNYYINDQLREFLEK